MMVIHGVFKNGRTQPIFVDDEGNEIDMVKGVGRDSEPPPSPPRRPPRVYVEPLQEVESTKVTTSEIESEVDYRTRYVPPDIAELQQRCDRLEGELRNLKKPKTTSRKKSMKFDASWIEGPIIAMMVVLVLSLLSAHFGW